MTDNFPEAGAIAFTTIKTPEGFTWNVTFRDVDGKEVTKRMIGFQVYCKENNWSPVEPRSFGKKEVKYVEGKLCPKCGGRLVEKTKSDGKPFHKCEHGKYNPLTKQNEGCDYIDWLNPTVPAWDKKEPYKNGGISVEDYEG